VLIEFITLNESKIEEADTPTNNQLIRAWQFRRFIVRASIRSNVTGYCLNLASYLSQQEPTKASRCISIWPL